MIIAGRDHRRGFWLKASFLKPPASRYKAEIDPPYGTRAFPQNS
jgi:hypothetical protein